VADVPGYRGGMIAVFAVSWVANAAATVAGLARLSPSPTSLGVSAAVDAGADVILAGASLAQYLLAKG